MVDIQPNQHELSSDDHVVRHGRPRDIVSPGVLSSNAFLLRNDEPFLSTNWVEYFHPSDRGIQILAVRDSLIAKDRTVKPNDLFIVLNVGVATNSCKARLGLDLRFVTLGEPDDPSHTGIYGIVSNLVNVASELAASVKPDEIYTARFPDVELPN